MGNSASFSKVLIAAAGAALAGFSAWNLFSSSGSCDNKAALEINIEEISELDGAINKRTITRSCDNKAASEINIEKRSEFDGAISKSDAYIKRSKGDAHLNPPLRQIKIMSYNVWQQEDVKVRERMKAIGRLIQKHSPNVIFFQLSKLPVKFFFNKRLENSNSAKGREIYIACLDAGNNKSFIAATSHLKSPVGPNTLKMNSIQRVAQAREALSYLKHLSHLRRLPNVVLGGDMNWDESMDGPFPLKCGWVDAWSTQRPEEDGWTFDTVTNQMLHGKHRMQKRLDRFVCKLLNFELTNIKIIGKQAIPGLRHRFKSMMNPVYPSDHFGVLLTISTI